MKSNQIVFKYIYFILLFSFLQTVISANYNEIIFKGGYTKFNKDIKNNYSLGSEFRLTTLDGLGFSFGANYITSTKTDGTNFRNIPLDVSICYNFNPKKSISPYFGGGVVANLLSTPYKTPTIGFIAKAGFNLRVARNNMLIIEVNKAYLSDTSNNLDLEPLSLKFGLSFILSKPNKERFQNPNSSVKTDRLLKRKIKRKNNARNKKRIMKTKRQLNRNQNKMRRQERNSFNY